MCRTPVFSDIVSERGGLRGLFREKARYFKKNGFNSYIPTIAHNAGYAPLAALNKCADNDIVGRATAAMQAWLEFQDTLTQNHLGEQILTAGMDETRPLYAVPKFGKQLPISRINRAAERLPVGNYTLLVLRRASSVRKNPKTRKKISHLFGKKCVESIVSDFS